jgi:ABC-type transporter Mla subunit MlaD
MDTENLKHNLKALRASLESADNLDPELAELLKGLDRDIRQLLDKRSQEPAGGGTLVERAQAISARLAIRHPHIEPAMREVADALARMGI